MRWSFKWHLYTRNLFLNRPTIPRPFSFHISVQAEELGISFQETHKTGIGNVVAPGTCPQLFAMCLLKCLARRMRPQKLLKFFFVFARQVPVQLLLHGCLEVCFRCVMRNTRTGPTAQKQWTLTSVYLQREHMEFYLHNPHYKNQNNN